MLILRNIRHLIAAADTILSNVDMLVEGTRIAAVGVSLDAPADAETVDCADCAVLPGFINAHTHLYQTLLMGRRDGLPLSGWCDEVLAPAVTSLYTDFAKEERARISYLWTAVGICEMLKSGITAFLNMDLNYGQDGMFRAAREANVRGYMGAELADLFLSDEKGLRRDVREIERLLAVYPASAVLAPSEPNLCSEDALRMMADLMRGSGALVQIHVDETAAEAARCAAERGMAELEYLDSFGLLSPRFSAVHGVHMNAGEIGLAAQKGVTVVYNPKSNAKLGSGVCPVPSLREAGVNLALATDGPASNDRLDMFEEMRFGVMLQRAFAKNSAALSAKEAFAMATVGGARMLRLDAGRLEAGMLADFSIVPLDRPHLSFGGGDPLATLVFCAKSGDVRDVYVGGKPALRDYRVAGLDETAIAREFSSISKRLREAIHVQPE